MATLTNTGRVALATAIKNKAVHLAWGSGLAAWDSAPPVETVGVSALTTEIGRRVAASMDYLIPDAAGTIESPFFNGAGTQTFSVSALPTAYLYMDFLFALSDAPTATIREVAVFVDTVGLIAGDYLAPADIQESGSLLVVEYLNPKIVRSAFKQERFEFVLSL